MKYVPIYELKQDLASYISEAESGKDLIITRHNKPVARLTRADAEHLHRPTTETKLKPAVKAKTAGRYLKILEEDRAEGRRR